MCLSKIFYLWHACWWHRSCAGVKVLSYNIHVQVLKGWSVLHNEIYAIWHVVHQVLSDPRGVQNYRNAYQVKTTPSSRLLINWKSSNKPKASVPLLLLPDPSFSPIHSLALTSALTSPFALSADVLLSVSFLSHLKQKSLLTPRTSNYKL